HEDTVSTRPLSRHRRRHPARSSQRGACGALCHLPAGRDGDPRDHGAADARDLMAAKSFSKSMQSPRKAVFIDKDSTLIEDIPYNADPEEIRLMPDALQGAHRLHAAGYALIVISN